MRQRKYTHYELDREEFYTFSSEVLWFRYTFSAEHWRVYHTFSAEWGECVGTKKIPDIAIGDCLTN